MTILSPSVLKGGLPSGLSCNLFAISWQAANFCANCQFFVFWAVQNLSIYMTFLGGAECRNRRPKQRAAEKWPENSRTRQLNRSTSRLNEIIWDLARPCFLLSYALFFFSSDKILHLEAHQTFRILDGSWNKFGISEASATSEINSYTYTLFCV